MASEDALRALVNALVAEQKRRQAAQFGGQDPREWLLDTLQAMARRYAALAHLHPLDTVDMSIAEKLACRYFLPEDLQPAGLGTEDQIWAEYRSTPANS
jgi:hypothetical protein